MSSTGSSSPEASRTAEGPRRRARGRLERPEAGSAPARPAAPARGAERRFHAINGVARVAFGLGPVLGALLGGALHLAGLVSPAEAVAAGVLAVALTWGFLGSISWVTARSIEATESAVETRRLLKAARSDPDHGQLSLSGEGGALSPGEGGE
jgi:hypothetical protein